MGLGRVHEPHHVVFNGRGDQNLAQQLRHSSDHFSAVVDRKSTRLNSSHSQISYAVLCLKKNNGQHRHDVVGRIGQLDNFIGASFEMLRAIATCQLDDTTLTSFDLLDVVYGA